MTLSLTLDGQPVVGYSNLQIKSVARGGFASVSFNLNRKLDKSLLATFTDVAVYDTATGEQVGGGRLMEQGRNDDGTWGITCLGEGLASMQDVTAPLAYVDQTVSNFFRKERSHKRQDVTITQYPAQSDDDSWMVWQATEDKGINTNASVTMTWPVPALCGMQLGGLQYRHKAGNNDGNMRVQSYAGTTGSPYGTSLQNDGLTATISPTIVRSRANFSGNYNAASFRWFCINSVPGASVDDSYWAAVRDFVGWIQPYGADGNLRDDHDEPYFLASEIFVDLIVRRTPRLKVGEVSSTAEHIEQMVYLDGIHAMAVMEDVLEVERAFNWDVYEPDADGLWPANLSEQPTEVRYEADTADGFSAPSPATEIFNRVTVTGKTPGGRDDNVTRSRAVPELDDVGVIRHATIQYGSEVWSDAAANKAGDDFLTEHSVAPNAGTLTIARRIRDRKTGRLVAPQHIRPNELIQLRGVQSTPDTLNATSPDGSTVFYIESMTYDDDSGAATLELDTPELTTTRAIAKLARSRNRRN